MRHARVLATACVLHALACLPPAHAGVVLSGTRIVFNGDAREATVRMDNRHAHPVLVEAWVEHGTPPASDKPALVPFAPHPPLVRIEPGKGQALRVHRLPGPLPTDRETLFWLNVLDIPPDLPASADASSMKIAVRTRIKLFHRPAGLAGRAAKAPAALRWRLTPSSALQVENPTPYHVTIARVVVHDDEEIRGDMVPPFTTLTLEASRMQPATTRIAFDAINDAGGLDRFTAELSP